MSSLVLSATFNTQVKRVLVFIYFNNHKSAIRRPNSTESVASHFQLPGHSISHLKIQGVEIVSHVSELNSAESRWIWTLKTHRITGGLNIDEPFLHNLTISNQTTLLHPFSYSAFPIFCHIVVSLFRMALLTYQIYTKIFLVNRKYAGLRRNITCHKAVIF